MFIVDIETGEHKDEATQNSQRNKFPEGGTDSHSTRSQQPAATEHREKLYRGRGPVSA